MKLFFSIKSPREDMPNVTKVLTKDNPPLWWSVLSAIMLFIIAMSVIALAASTTKIKKGANPKGGTMTV